MAPVKTHMYENLYWLEFLGGIYSAGETGEKKWSEKGIWRRKVIISTLLLSFCFLIASSTGHLSQIRSACLITALPVACRPSTTTLCFSHDILNSVTNFLQVLFSLSAPSVLVKHLTAHSDLPFPNITLPFPKCLCTTSINRTEQLVCYDFDLLPLILSAALLLHFQILYFSLLCFVTDFG